MKLNGDWFYDQLKDALKTLGLTWGDKGLLVIRIDDRTGLITFQADRRMLQVPADEDIRNEVEPDALRIEMLEALKAARDLWGDYLPPGNSNAMKAMKLVNAAIAKATSISN